MVSACAYPAADVSRREAPIVGGEPSLAGLEDAVLLLEIRGESGAGTCSASLVAPTLVLTARHCIAPFILGDFDCDTRGELVSESGAGSFELPHPVAAITLLVGRDREPSAFGKKVFSLNPVSICRNDIVLVLLDREVSLPPLPLRRAPARSGELVTVVGFGLSGSGSAEVEQRQRKTALAIEAVGPDSLAEGEGDIAPRLFSIRGPVMCDGDSGGPAIAEDGGVLGIYTTQRGVSCEDEETVNFFVHVPAYEELILEGFQEAGTLPSYSDASPVEGAPDPGDLGAPSATSPGCTYAPRVNSRGTLGLLALLLAGLQRALSAARRVGRRPASRSERSCAAAQAEARAAPGPWRADSLASPSPVDSRG